MSEVQYGFDHEPALVATDSHVPRRIFDFVTRLPIPAMNQNQERGQPEVLRWLRASLDASIVRTPTLLLFRDCT